jgi:hypothetical protein
VISAVSTTNVHLQSPYGTAYGHYAVHVLLVVTVTDRYKV